MYESDLATTQTLAVTISSGTTTTPEINLLGGVLCGLIFPAAMTSATLKIQVAAVSGGNYVNLQKDELGGGDYTLTVTANKAIPISNLAVLKGWQFIKLVSASSEAADRSISIQIALI